MKIFINLLGDNLLTYSLRHFPVAWNGDCHHDTNSAGDYVWKKRVAVSSSLTFKLSWLFQSFQYSIHTYTIYIYIYNNQSCNMSILVNSFPFRLLALQSTETLRFTDRRCQYSVSSRRFSSRSSWFRNLISPPQDRSCRITLKQLSRRSLTFNVQDLCRRKLVQVPMAL